MTKWVNPVTTTNDADIKLVHDADIKLVHTDNTDVIANACKKIAELEKENEELRKNGFTVSAMTEQQFKVAIEKGEQLEKENADLRDNYDQFKASAIPEIERLQKENAELKDKNETQAKILETNLEELANAGKKIKELEQQIEKMKAMLNKHRDCWSCDFEDTDVEEEPCTCCHSCCNWKLKE